MKIELKPTGIIETVNGNPCRVWKGTSDKGIYVIAYIALIGADQEHASQEQIADFGRELQEVKVDRNLVSFDMRML